MWASELQRSDFCWDIARKNYRRASILKEYRSHGCFRACDLPMGLMGIDKAYYPQANV